MKVQPRHGSVLFLILFPLNICLKYAKDVKFRTKAENRNVVLKTEQTTIVYAQCCRWMSYDMIKHRMITTNVISK